MDNNFTESKLFKYVCLPILAIVAWLSVMYMCWLGFSSGIFIIAVIIALVFFPIIMKYKEIKEFFSSKNKEDKLKRFITMFVFITLNYWPYIFFFIKDNVCSEQFTHVSIGSYNEYYDFIVSLMVSLIFIAIIQFAQMIVFHLFNNIFDISLEDIFLKILNWFKKSPQINRRDSH